MSESNSAFWNSGSGRPLDISFHFTKKEKITTLQVKCPPYGGANPTMTVYYAQNGDAELTLYKEIATISTAGREVYKFNEEGISADYWVVRFTSSGWIDLRLCSPSGLFTTGLYTEKCFQQIMERVSGYQPTGNYQPKGNYVTTDTTQTISAKKTFSTTPALSAIPNKKVIGTDANGLIEAHALGIDDITDLRLQLNGKQPSGAYADRQSAQTITGNWTFTGTTNFNGTTKINGNEIATKGYVDGIFDSKANKTHTHAISDVIDLQTRLDGKMDAYTITDEPSSMNKDGFAQFRHGLYYPLTKNSQLQRAFGYVNAVEKGGQISNNNSYFTGFGYVGGGTYIGTAVYDRDYGIPTDALYSSYGLLIDAYGSAFLLSGSKDSETIKRIATTDDTNSLQNSIDGKANVGHTHTISQINNLQDALDRKQNTIQNPCSFNGSNGNYVKLSRDGTSNYYVEIEHGSVTYNGSTTQYPEINVTFPHKFNVESVNDKPTVIVSFAPTSNSTGTYEALKVINVTSTGFTVITRMSASISGGYFRVNWIAIYTV